VCGALPAALLAAIVAVPAALWSRLPARVADHWTLTGTADGTAPRLLPIVLSGPIALLGAALVWLAWARARSVGSRSGHLATPRATRGVTGRPGRAMGLAGLIDGTVPDRDQRGVGDHGGGGQPGRREPAVALRPGPALRLTLRDGKTFLVTVDDAATGAALLNDLIAGPRPDGEASGP